jgi:hypothetical protein
MTPEEFESRWMRLPTPGLEHQLQADEVVPGSGVWIARDRHDERQLLVQIPPGFESDVPPTHGLSCVVARHQVADAKEAHYIVLKCLAEGAAETFAVIACEVVNASASQPLGARPSVVQSVLAEWRWFWGADAGRLTNADAIGLFAELWFMVRVAGATPATVEAWNGSSGSRHDFQWAQRSVEVKATARSGPVVHSIAHLDQLADPEQGVLYLYSLRLTRDALATNTLLRLVEAAKAQLEAHPSTLSSFLAKLSARGVTAASRDEATVGYRVLDEAFYAVTEDFPRLTPATFVEGLPAAIPKVSYLLDMNACEPWRIGSTTITWPPA